MRRDTPTWRLEPTLRFLALLPLALVASGLVMEIGARGLHLPTAPRPVWFMAISTGLAHVLVLGFAAQLLKLHGHGWSDAFGFLAPGCSRRYVFAAGLTVPALAGAWIIHQGSALVLQSLGVPPESQLAIEAIRHSSRSWERALILVFAAVTAPAAEEVLFRGVLWPWLRDLGYPKAGFLGSSFLFALIHFNAAAFLALWLLGMFWTWLYQRTGDLFAPMISHSIFNLVNFAWIVLASPPAIP